MSLPNPCLSVSPIKVTGAHLELLSRSDGMTAVLQLRLTEPVVRKVLLTAHRFIASEALASGIVDEVVPASGSEATIAFAVNKGSDMAPLAESGVSTATVLRLEPSHSLARPAHRALPPAGPPCHEANLVRPGSHVARSQRVADGRPAPARERQSLRSASCCGSCGKAVAPLQSDLLLPNQRARSGSLPSA